MKNKKINVEKIIYNVLKNRPFSKECLGENKEIYDAYCLRVAETVDIKIEEQYGNVA